MHLPSFSGFSSQREALPKIAFADPIAAWISHYQERAAPKREIRSDDVL
jgi:hypothetical protein